MNIENILLNDKIGINNPEILIVLFGLIIWSLIWKGLALWKAGRAGEKKWFIALLVVNTFGLLEIIYLFTEKKKFRLIWTSFLAIVIILCVGIFTYREVQKSEKLQLDTYTRIIYGTTKPDTNTLNGWKTDCAKHLGRFSECGSSCLETNKNTGCGAVCAYTCELIPLD